MNLTAGVLGMSSVDDPAGSMIDIGLRFAKQLAIVLVYLAPSIIAQKYRHPKQPVILMLNVALGWTIIGWIVALIWALKARPQE